MSLASDVISILGKSASDADVRRTIDAYALVDTYDDPPFRRYVGSKKKGVCLLFDEDRIIDVQIYVQPTKLYSAIDDSLPFGIEKEMNQQQVHQLLGKPESSDAFDGKYAIDGGNHRLTVVYNKQGIVRYLSVALPME